ncbi:MULTISPECIES: hypothetical protein [Streptomyces]|uniref:hypothetical protein n=1 Tax=Streptomyces TaxID=1883 RepID=UPI001CCA28DB|nr:MULTISPECIES: hypothetical protein [Streptomyces]UBI39130.1 hypothetical protein K7I03_23535 [Streptomyces mobaraensis]UKW31710.1 hypothetical protein MCU78_23480 [Streptomyces sp. TYQ1024]
MRPAYLVGRRLEQVVASWHLYGSEAPSGPLDVWLIDSEQVSTRVTTGSDWCLIVDRSAPGPGYDMAESGRVEVTPIRGETPFADHLGETIRAVDEEWDPRTGRIALVLTFGSGARVRCGTWSGDLSLTSEGSGSGVG